jgi:hypothetical protein
MGETEGWAKVLRRAVPAGGAALVGTLRLPAIDATWVLKRSLLSRIGPPIEIGYCRFRLPH